MKSYGGLFERIAEPDNLRLAFIKAVRGKRNRPEVKRWTADIDKNLTELRTQLLTGRLKVGNYRFFTVYDPKRREICAASFGERVLHHAIMNICEPVFENTYIYDTYACRKGKGQQKAVLRAREFCREFGWYLKLDIRRYFDSINHGLLLALLRKKFRERRVVSLFEQIFATYYSNKAGCGLPIGNLISQHCANFWLGVFDHQIKDTDGWKGYLRYMDDFLLFANTKKELQDQLRHVCLFLREQLALEIKENIQLNRCRFGIPFLGYRVYPSKIRLGSLSKKRFVWRYNDYMSNFEKGIWSEQELAEHLLPVVEFTRFANAGNFRQRVIEKRELP